LKEELEEIKTFYDDVYYADTTSSPKTSAHLERLARKVGIGRGEAVLDVACGRGEWLLTCHEVGADVSGVDLSEQAIAACKKHLPYGEFHATPAEDLPFGNARFDLVTCLGSLEHFVEPILSLREMTRVAKDNARFLILVPNADFLTRRLSLFGGTYQVDAKEVVRTLDEWERLFEEAGLRVTSRWKDLHVLKWSWIRLGGWKHVPLRLLQVVALIFWPLRWQYQVYHLCVKR